MNEDLRPLEQSVERIEDALRSYDAAMSAVVAAEKALAETTNSKSFLDVAKKTRSNLGLLWQNEELFGRPQDTSRKHLVSDLSDRCDVLIKRLTPSPWNDGARIEPHQIVFKTGSR
jgi:hypothetical protein